MRRGAIFAFAFSAAVLLSRFIPTITVLCIGGLLLLVAYILAPMSGRRSKTTFIISAGAAIALIWCFIFDTWILAPVRHYDGNTCDVSVKVVGYPDEYSLGVRVPVRLDGISSELFVHFASAEGFEPSPGDIVEVRARCESTQGLSLRSSVTSKGVQLFLYAECRPTVAASGGGGIRYFPARIAYLVKNKIDALFPTDAAPFMQALLTGDRDAMYSGDAYFCSMLAISGTSHIVAVSGMHMAFLVGFIQLILGKRRRLSLLAAPVIVMFMALVGFTPSVCRAGIMQLMLLFAPFLMREYDPVTALALSLMALLAINPSAVLNPGLQMSYAAVAGILLFYRRLNAVLTKPLGKKRQLRRFERWLNTFLSKAVSTVALSLSAQVFVMPLTVLYYGSVSIISPLTNLLILWAVSLAFGIGALAVALSFVLTPLGTALAVVPTLLTRYIRLVVTLLGRIPFAELTTGSFYVSVWLFAMYAILVILLHAKKQAKRLPILAGSGVVLVAVAIIFSIADPRLTSIEATALDVQQGQCVVISSGESVYVADCGGDTFDNPGDIAADYISSKGYRSISAVVLTHYHEDHACGLLQLMRRIPVTTLYAPDHKDDEEAKAILDEARALGVSVNIITELTEVESKGISLTLYPPVGIDEENELGLTAMFSKEDYDIFMAGDMNGLTESIFLELFQPPDTELLLVGHHGSKYSTTDKLLDALAPELAFISVGENPYGHPAAELLERLERHGAAVYRTDINGTITIRLGKGGEG